MYNKFKSIDYLKNGSLIQKKAFKILTKTNIMPILKKFDPVLVGTIPIEINIETSDLDIICEVYNFKEFIKTIKDNFSDYDRFEVKKHKKYVTANFFVDNFEIEIYGESLAVENQNAYKHMCIEYRILKLMESTSFKNEIIEMKECGLKTEPAFCKLLGIDKNCYKKLIEMNHRTDLEIKNRVRLEKKYECEH